METNILISELEKRMRPGVYSSVGFLGPQESLEAVLRQDNLSVQRLGLTFDQLASRLRNILTTVLDQRNHLLLTNYEEYRQREYHSINWHHQDAPLFSLNDLPDLEIGYLLDGKYQVLLIQTRGVQECPWDCQSDDNWSSFDFLLLNRDTGEYITGPGLIVHLIQRHHFFEGMDSPYRVDPILLAKVLELI